MSEIQTALDLAEDIPAVVAPIVVRLPSLGSAPLPSSDLAGAGEAAHDTGVAIAPWQVEALSFGAGDATRALLSLGAEQSVRSFEIGDDLRFWILMARLTLELLYRQRLLPVLEERRPDLAERPHQRDDAYVAGWAPLVDEEPDRQRIAALIRSMPPACRAYAWPSRSTGPEMHPAALLSGFLAAAVDALARQALAGYLPGLLTAAKGKGRRKQPAPARSWVTALAGEAELHGAPIELAKFRTEYRAWSEAAAAEPAGADSFRICFRLDPPLLTPLLMADADADPHPANEDWTLSYLLQASDDPSLLVSVGEVWRHRGSTARFLNRRFDNPQERLLAGLGRASRLCPPIERSLHEATPEACSLTATEAHEFVREGALLLQSSGFGVLVPALERKLGLRLKLGAKVRSQQRGGVATLNWDRVVEYDWELAIGDEPLSREEFETLADLKQPLVQVRGHWVELRPEQVEQVLALFRSQDANGEMSIEEALRQALAPETKGGLPVLEVETAGWIDDLLRDLREGGHQEAVAEPPGFIGQLRPYQKAGVSWLASLSRYGVGACLADDMGLGKTVQLIALLLHQVAAGNGEPALPTLLICPTSVVGNWRHELTRFAPDLRVLIHHGAGRTRSGFAEEALAHDVVISTYALLHRDEAELATVEWANVVLDEAQNIKNASTRAAQAARRLRARWRVALTGTPIENRLSDLWSLFQFLDPGYLGSAEDFHRRYAGPIERTGDTAATNRLKALVSPLILRRLKTDRSIIDDLPEKNEMKVFCTLTREQATLYEAVLRDSVRQIESAEGIERRGLILAMIAKLKQACDHPALLLKDGSALGGRSGKLVRLEEMLQEALALGDRALIFSQYAEMGALLKAHLETELGQEVLFLHGGTPAAQRDRMVTRFQEERHGPPIFILSIKAGGTGLNLTRANHVFHFDRWWNPAVENQATDRAFRIGQRRDVQVHKFICAGTFEEAIDELIERKIALSQSIVGTSEAWITEMSTDQLRDLFALRADAVATG